MKVTKVHSNWPEKGQRRRKWMAPAAAAKRVQEKGLRKILLAFFDDTAEAA